MARNRVGSSSADEAPGGGGGTAASPGVVGYASVFLLALVVRGLYLLELADTAWVDVLLGDSRQYDAWAREIAAGEWLGRETFYQAPLYPYILGLLYRVVAPDVGLVRALQAVAGAGSCALLAAAGKRFFSGGVGVVAGVMLALYPPAVFFDALVQKTSLSLFFLTLLLATAAWATASPGSWPWLSTGLILGGLALLRENALVLAVVLALWIVLAPASVPTTPTISRGWRRPSLGVALFLAGLAVPLLCAGLRNLAVGGELLLTTSQSGPNFYIGNHLEANGRYVPLVPGGGDARVEGSDAATLARLDLGRDLTPGEVSRYWWHRAWEYVRSHPWHWLRLLSKKWYLVWHADEIVDTHSIEAYAESSRLLSSLYVVWHMGVLCPLAGVGVWWTGRRWRELWLLYAVALCLASSVALFYVVGRYRLSLVPILILFAAAGLGEMGRRWRGSSSAPGKGRPGDAGRWRVSRDGIVAGLVAVLVAVPVNWPLRDADDPRATAYLNLGVTLLEEGDSSRALLFLERAAALVPDFAATHQALGRALMANGRLAEAESRFRRALTFDPGNAATHLSLARVLVQEGEQRAAVEQYRLGLARDPGNAGAHSGLGHLLVTQGQIDAAMHHYRQAIALDPEFAFAHNQLGNALMASGQAEAAQREYEVALALDPGLADAHFKLAHLLVERGQREGAQRHFAQTIRLLPEFADGHYWLARNLDALGRGPAAAAAYRRVLELDPRHPGALEALREATGQ